jgi:hypothetical protein
MLNTQYCQYCNTALLLWCVQVPGKKKDAKRWLAAVKRIWTTCNGPGLDSMFDMHFGAALRVAGLV